MKRFYSYQNTALQVLENYSGEIPFASHLKNFFSAEKKYGSSDRKHIAQLCYCYFRLGKLGFNDAKQRMAAALFLCTTEPSELLASFDEELNANVTLTLLEKLAYLKIEIDDLFPWKNELENEIDAIIFSKSFLIQPDLFLRVRQGKDKSVKEKLHEADITFKDKHHHCLALLNATKIDDVLEIDKDVVVQDMSSQKVSGFIETAIGKKFTFKVWDCCAASGGKSILAYDVNPNIILTVSDIRESILINLKKRFTVAGIKTYRSFIADLADENYKSLKHNFQFIICDVPCSGSGTWARTPEQLCFFDQSKIEEYAALQKKIVVNAMKQLEPGGYFLYITCSVFKKENSEVVDFIKKEFHLELTKMELIKGYDDKADTMFAALLHKAL